MDVRDAVLASLLEYDMLYGTDKVIGTYTRTDCI